MTVIAYSAGVLAADKRTVSQGRPSTTTKIFRSRGWLLGISGELALGLEMVEWFSKGAKAEDLPKRQSTDDYSLLLAISPEREIYLYERSHVPILMEEPFFAMGSGRDYALAAMYLGADPAKAVAITCALDNTCGNGIDVLELAKDGIEDAVVKS